MRGLRFAVRALMAVAWIFLGLLTIGFVFPLVGLSRRLWLKKQWSRVLLWISGIDWRVCGEPIRSGPVLFAINHVSWLDIFVLNCARPTTFVAKSEIRSWPLIGWLAAGADTIFIERGFRHAVHRVGLAMQARFLRGQAVGLFPEGTTSEGFDLLPFYANLFEPAIQSGVVVQPVALRFFHRGQRSSHAAFVGEQTLISNIWRVFSEGDVMIEMVFLQPSWNGQAPAPTRAELARQTRQIIRPALDAINQTG